MVTNFKDTRAAVVGPNTLLRTPGYYIILTRKALKEPTFLKEFSDTSDKTLFLNLLKDEVELRFNTVYFDVNVTNKKLPPSPFSLALMDNLTKMAPWIRACPSHFFYGKDVGQGVGLISSWKGLETFPADSVLREQIRKLTPDNIEGDDLYAFTALRYILGGYNLEKSSAAQTATAREKALKERETLNLDKASTEASKEYDRIIDHIKGEQDYLEDRHGIVI